VAGRVRPVAAFRLGLPAGEAPAGLLAAVLAECLHRERWQGEYRTAGSGLDRPDRQFLAPAAFAGVGVGKDGRVDDPGGDRQPGPRQPRVGRHLAATVRTGRYCSYTPDPRAPIAWER
jgi:hypothetical protein